MNKPAAIYARVSSDRQKENQTITSQTAALKEYAATHGYLVPAEWVFEDDGYSGAHLIRPGLESVRDLAAQLGLPFHFMLRCCSPEGYVYIDVFDGGTLLNEQQCRERIYRIGGGKVKIPAYLFEPVSQRQLLSRLLQNLKHIYLHKEEYLRVLAVCNRLLLLDPRSAIERRDRGIVYLQLKSYGRALSDLKAYLELAPRARDRDEILGHIKTIRQMISMMN